MHKLMKISNHEYMFYSVANNLSKVGTIEDVSAFMVDEVGVIDEEIDSALVDMHLRSNNVAEFGVNGKFVFSTRVESKTA